MMTTNDCKCVDGIKAGCPVHENEYLDELMDYARSLGKPVFVIHSEALIGEDICEVKKQDKEKYRSSALMIEEHNYQPQFTPDIIGRCMLCGVEKEEHLKVGDKK
ncbi:hypothetical protein LCGC14_0381630 [marine sediment metagenome]|uniref:Uncharacterized protein n=1 Tax=marine sediment metagenome TaxID=412755 RepID=A0A0F9VPC8_9ZZZZ